MNDKIMLFIKIPMIEEEINILVPLTKKIGNVKEEIEKYINEILPNSISKTPNMSLYDKETGKLIQNNLYIKNSNLTNGQTLILI